MNETPFVRRPALALFGILGVLLGSAGTAAWSRADAPAVSDYLIVTTRALAPSFMRLAVAKSGRGRPATIVTLEDIRAAGGPGRDDPERIRLVLQAARAAGVHWVMLGGDFATIPARIVPFGPGIPLDPYPTDLYYAALDGTWDADGDGVFAEPPLNGDPGDDPDVVPDVHVGRAPVATPEEARAFVAKAIAASRWHGPSDVPPIVLLGEVLFPTPWTPDQFPAIDGAAGAEQVITAFPDRAPDSFTRLYQNVAPYPLAQPLSHDAAVAALAGDSHVAFHVGRAGPHVLALGEEFLTAADAPLLAQGEAPLHLVSIGSFAAQAPPGSFSRALLLEGPRRGASLVAPTGSLFTLPAFVFEQELARAFAAGAPAIGLAVDAARTAIAPQPNQARFAMALLGDPQAPVALEPADPLATGGTSDVTSPQPEEPTRPHGRLSAIAAGGSAVDVRVSFAAEDAGTAFALRIFDVRGRCLKEIARGLAARERQTWAWGGETDGGRAAGPGVYFLVLTLGAERETRRVVLAGR